MESAVQTYLRRTVERRLLGGGEHAANRRDVQVLQDLALLLNHVLRLTRPRQPYRDHPFVLRDELLQLGHSSSQRCQLLLISPADLLLELLPHINHDLRGTSRPNPPPPARLRSC